MNLKELLTEKANLAWEEIRSLSHLQKALAIFVLLFFILIIDAATSSHSPKTKAFLPKLNIDTVKKVEIIKPGKSGKLSLEKREDIWWVINGHSFPADSENINQLLTGIKHLKEEKVVSKNPKRMSLFEVDESQGFKIRIWDEKGQKVADFYAGKVNQLNQQYLKKEGAQEVVEVNNNIKPLISQDTEDWKDKTILKVEEVNVKRVVLSKEKDEVIIEKKENQWTLTQYNQKPADALAVRTLFDQLRHLRADEFIEPSEGSQIDFDEPDFKISVRWNNDDISVVLFKAKDEKSFYVKTGKSNFIYLASKDLIDQIFELELKD